jgi:hypothetical protein
VKLAIFENEFNNLKASFDAINLLHFNNEAVIDVFETFQSFKNLSDLISYDYVLIDLDLSAKSNKDGYEIIKELLNLKFPLKKLFILTGHVNVKEKLMEKGLPDISIIQKPLTIDSLEKHLIA